MLWPPLKWHDGQALSLPRQIAWILILAAENMEYASLGMVAPSQSFLVQVPFQLSLTW